MTERAATRTIGSTPAPATTTVNGTDELQFRVIHGHRRAFRLTGHGPALLLVHGIGDSSESWTDVVDELARDHTVIAPDLLGHGASDKPRADYSVPAYANAMRDLLDVLGIDRVTVVGHSLGGGVAAQLAYQYPERCERLVLVATGGVARDVSPVMRLASLPLADMALVPLRFLPASLTSTAVLAAMRLVGNGADRDAAEMRRVIERLADDRARVAFTRTLRSVVDWRGQVVTLRDRCYLADMVPTLVVWGTEDGIIPPSHAPLLEAAMPQSRVEIFDGAGHSPHHSDPERFVAVLRDFLATTEPATYDAERWQSRLRAGGPDAPDDAGVLAAARVQDGARAAAGTPLLAEPRRPGAGQPLDDLLDPDETDAPVAAGGS